MARVLLCHQPNEDQPVLDIALSERNLVVLLSKLYTPGSACSFLNGDVPEGFAHACFRAEPDELHYAFPTRDGGPPGPMHPLAELVHAVIKQLLSEVLYRDSLLTGPVEASLAAEDSRQLVLMRALSCALDGRKEGDR
jgi:hypothetical protein